MAQNNDERARKDVRFTSDVRFMGYRVYDAIMRRIGVSGALKASTMFKNLLRELDQLKGTTSIGVPIEADGEGYYDKECPAENCLFGFKVHGDDWTKLVRDEEVFCPACRYSAPSKSWYTRDQIERAREYAVKQLQGRINSAIRQDASDWNRRQPRNAFIKMTMDVRGVSTPVLMPIAAADPMRLRTGCETCGCRYSYIGAAFFCPACGANSAHHTFRQTLATIRAAAGSGDILRQSLDPDQAEVLSRSLLEKGFQDAVMSFQRLCEQLYAEIPGAPGPRRNVFQNLDSGSDLWASAVGANYEQMVGSDAMRRLRTYFQQRHLIAHRQGIVDADYIARSGDSGYGVGQRLIISKSGVFDFVELIERLGTAILEYRPKGGSDQEKQDAGL
jgi:hypothetical protein